MAIAHQPGGVQLNAFERRIDKASGTARGVLFAQHMPGLERETQFHLHTLGHEIAQPREAEVEVWRKPVGLDRVAEATQLLHHVAQVLPDEVRQHEAVVQLGAPSLQARRPVRLLPEARHQRTHQQLLSEAHAGVRRHLEGTHLEQAEPAGRAVGRVQLVDAELGAVGVAGDVDEQVAHQPIDEPRRRGMAPCIARDAGEFGEGDLDLVDRIVARLVDARRLAGRADEEAAEQVAERRVVVPVADHAREQIGAPQEG